MHRMSRVRVAFLCAIPALFVSCKDVPSEPPPDTPVPVVQQYDFFPPLAVGDTISWDYIHAVTPPRGTPSSPTTIDAIGIMTWTVVDKKTSGDSTNLQVTQIFRGTVKTLLYSGTVTTPVDGALATVMITEDANHTVTIDGGTTGIRTGSWYTPPYATFPRFRPAALGDTLTASSASTLSSVKARQAFGPFQIEYDHNTPDLRKQQARYVRRTGQTPADTIPVDPLRWGDFFPPFHAGETASWEYTSRYTSISGPGYTVTGIMRWVVNRVTTGPTGTTAEVQQTLNALLITWRYAETWIPDTIRIANVTSTATILEDTGHVITARLPIAWMQASPGYLAPWTFTAPRYGFNNSRDDLVAVTKTSAASGSLQLVRDAGPIMISYRESTMSYNEVTMKRRQEY